VDGWDGANASLSPAVGGPDGDGAALVTLGAEAADYSIHPARRPVAATSWGSLYSASAWVRSETAGRTVCARVREWAGRRLVASRKSCVTAGAEWQQIPPVVYMARGNWHELDADVYQAGPLPGDSFEVDAAELVAVEPPPAEVGASLPPQLPPSTGNTFYVSPSGSDANPGSEAAPWRTVQKAFDTLQPGQTALVRGGTYAANHAMSRAGTPTQPITVAAYPGERPVLHAASGSPSYPLRLRPGAAYVRVSGFVIEDSPVVGNVNVYVVAGAHHVEISDNEIRDAKDATGLYVDPGAHHVSILRNVVHHNNGPSHQHQGIYIMSDDTLIAGNVVYGHTNGFGIQVRRGDGTGPNRVIVAGNTSVRNSQAGIVLEDAASDVLLVNNVVAFNGASGIRGYRAGQRLGTGNVAWNNLLYGNAGVECDGNGIVDCGQNLGADPLFADLSAWNLHVRAGSPAVDVALPDYSLAFDRDGRPRETPDLGAYER
jgi:hypothetical protein